APPRGTVAVSRGGAVLPRTRGSGRGAGRVVPDRRRSGFVDCRRGGVWAHGPRDRGRTSGAGPRGAIPGQARGVGRRRRCRAAPREERVRAACGTVTDRADPTSRR